LSLTLLEEPAVRQQIARFSVASYRQMVESGLLPEQTELMQGVIVYQMTKSPDHNYFVTGIYELLRPIIPSGTLILRENSLSAGDSELEPDIMVVAGPLSRYRSENPETALLVVEVSRSSLQFDRVKANLYARQEIAEYWIIDIEEQQIEIYGQPTAAGYQTQRISPFASPVPVFGQALHISELL